MDRPLDSLLDDLELPGHRAVAEHWLELHARSRGIPALSALDPLRFPRALADTWIVDATDDGRFRFRLMGETLVNWYGRKTKGLYYEDLFPPALVPDLHGQSRAVLERPCIAFQHLQVEAREPYLPRHFQRLVLPLCDAAGRPAHLLGNSVFNQTQDGPVPQISYWYPIV